MLDTDLLRRAAANVETEAMAAYDRYVMTGASPTLKTCRRLYERYAKLRRVATELSRLVTQKEDQ